MNMIKEEKVSSRINVPKTVMTFTIIICGLLLIYLNGVFWQINQVVLNPSKNIEVSQNGENILEEYFPGCNIIDNNCINSSCDKFSFCNDKEYQTCEIYDCQRDFGIGTIDSEQNIDIRRKVKYDRILAEKMIEKCRGNIEVIDSSCLKDSLQLKIIVSTNGECEIRSFMAKYKKKDDKEIAKYVKADFSQIDDNFYLASFNSCDNYSQLIAVGGGGVSIREKQ